MKPKVSIIVPIYNVAAYLERGIESLLAQTLKEIEIILVNDGSTDESLVICNRYKALDSRIIVINKENGGVSSARNEGLLIASGDYIGFIDPDDWIESDMFEKMFVKAKETSSEVVFCDFLYEDEQNNTKKVLLEMENEKLDGNEILECLIKDMISAPDLNSGATTISGSACRILVNSEIIKNNRIYFEEKIFFMEDLIFVLQVLLSSNRVTFVQECLYHYILRGNSAVTSYQPHFFENNLFVFDKLRAVIEQKDKLDVLEERLMIHYVNIFVMSIANEVHKGNQSSFKEKIKKINGLCKDKKLKKILEKLDFKAFTLRKKVVLKSIQHENALLLLIYYNTLSLYLKFKKA